VPASRRPLGLAVLSLLLTIALPVSATSVSVTGTGYFGNDTNGLTATAGNFSAASGAPGGQSFVGFGAVGVAMTLSWEANPFTGFGFTLVNVGKQVTDILDGAILFTSTFTVPASALVSGTFSTPVDLSGNLQAFQDLTYGQGDVTPGLRMASLLFSGKGASTLILNDLGQGNFEIIRVFATFNGNGTLQTVVPEPTSLVLLGTGLAILAGIVRRKRRLIRT
jgi:PEP-CTERM motif